MGKNIFFISVISIGLLTLAAGCSTESLPAPYDEPEVDVEMTDRVFQEYCLANFDYNGDGKLTSYELGIVSVLEIADKGIGSLEGIEYFTKMYRLDCSGNNIGTLSLGKCKMLTELKCSDCSLTSISFVDGNSECKRLRLLDCSGNPGLPAEFDMQQQPELAELVCSGSGINRFKWEVGKPDSMTVLKRLIMDDVRAENGRRDFSIFGNISEISVRNNGLVEMTFPDSIPHFTKLDISGNSFTGYLRMDSLPTLRYLKATGMLISDFNVGKCTGLDTLVCSDNLLTGINLSANTRLKRVECAGNRIKNITVNIGSGLTYLDCSNNEITELLLDKNTGLEELYCNENSLINELNLRANAAIKKLDCRDNPNERGLKIYVWPDFNENAGEYLKDPNAVFVKDDAPPAP